MTFDQAMSELRTLYPGRMIINKQETSRMLGRSIPTLDRDIKNKYGVGFFAQKQKGRVYFTLYDIAQFLSNDNEARA